MRFCLFSFTFLLLCTLQHFVLLCTLRHFCSIHFTAPYHLNDWFTDEHTPFCTFCTFQFLYFLLNSFEIWILHFQWLPSCCNSWVVTSAIHSLWNFWCTLYISETIQNFIKLHTKDSNQCQTDESWIGAASLKAAQGEWTNLGRKYNAHLCIKSCLPDNDSVLLRQHMPQVPSTAGTSTHSGSRGPIFGNPWYRRHGCGTYQALLT